MRTEWRLGLHPSRKWCESEALGCDSELVVCVGGHVAALIAYGVRELADNAHRHGGGGDDSEVTLTLDAATKRLALILPGTCFDSVQSSKEESSRFLHRFHRLMMMHGVRWSYDDGGGLNRIELDLMDVWIEAQENEA